MKLFHGVTAEKAWDGRVTFAAFDRDLAEDYASDLVTARELEFEPHNPLLLRTGEEVREYWGENGEHLHAERTFNEANVRRALIAREAGYDAVVVMPTSCDGDVGYDWTVGTFGEPQVIILEPERIEWLS